MHRQDILEVRIMPHSAINQKIINRLDRLPVKLQKKVLEFMNSLVTPKSQGASGRDLICFAGSIPSKALKDMEQAIEQGCEKVDINEW
jgi:hypothetical protein